MHEHFITIFQEFLMYDDLRFKIWCLRTLIDPALESFKIGDL